MAALPDAAEASAAEAQDAIASEFAFFGDWTERYQYLIDLGRKLAPFPDEWRTDEHKVQGCQSQVWLVPELKDGVLSFKGDSDAIIVRGLIAVVLTIFKDKTPAEIAAFSLDDIFARLGLEEHLSPSRRNGLLSMIEKIRFYASHLQE